MMVTTSCKPQVSNSDYYMSAQAGPSPPEAYLYGGNRGVYASPTSQTPPSNNISPINWNSSQANVRQLRQPRQPMYVPAALRPTDTKPTDIPNRPRAPDTPPASKDNSFDSVKSNHTPSIAISGMSRMDSVQESDIEALRRGLSRAASDGLDEELGHVTGLPTTAHWKPDTTATECKVCHETFTWFFRRHHCRRCGDVVCDNHITKRVPLDQNARYHPNGFESKACDPCWQEWTVVTKLRHSRANSIAGSHSSQGTTVPALTIPNQPRTLQDARVGSMARSEGMVWSTF